MTKKLVLILSIFFSATLFPQYKEYVLNASLQENEAFTDSLRISEYLTFLNNFSDHLGPPGSYKKGEIEVILELDKILGIQEIQYNRLISRGCSEDEAKMWSQVGIIDTDTYWIWIRDAVVFPSGVVGTYDRLLWKNSVDGPNNVVVLPVLNDGKVVLNLNFRHATRSWEVELPRGGRLFGETVEKASKRELRDETGCLTESLLFLGSLTPDSSTLNTVTPVFLGFVKEQIEPHQEFSEAILGLLSLTKFEIKEAFKKGYLEVEIKGEPHQVPFRDPYLAYAVFQAENKGLL